MVVGGFRGVGRSAERVSKRPRIRNIMTIMRAQGRWSGKERQ
jgi:hypothetical protein